MKAPLKLSVMALLACASFLHAQDSMDISAGHNATNDSMAPLSARNPEWYSTIIGQNKAIVTRHREEQGYLIENGRFRNEKGEVGSIVMVSSPDQDVLAITDFPNDSKVMIINRSKGKRVVDLGKHKLSYEGDTVPSAEGDSFVSENSSSPLENKSIEILVAYSTYALGKLDVDPVAYALAQVEMAREGLDNSKILGITLSLGGVLIFDAGAGYDTTGSGLKKWQDSMAPYRSLFRTDVNMAITGTGSGPSGMAYVSGYTSANGWFAAAAFRHELGHNVGGSHCNSGSDSYKFGYSNGKSKTFLCGNNAPYYSAPDVKDDYDLPLGNKQTADMARLWQEQAGRMAGYNAPLEGVKLIFVSRGESHVIKHRLNTSSAAAAAGFIALSPEVGPTELAANPSTGYSPLTVKLKDFQGAEHVVKFRGQRAIGGCVYGPMNKNSACSGGGGLHLKFSYDPVDNTSLAQGTYNGLLQLRAKDSRDASYNILVNIPIALEK